ncbi:membrane protein [Streptomyces phage Hiyaa]|uniref:Membrane protein n=1 Tax=Streptomyces phage Hiyaa TaxID=2499072 RepID=A0A3S9U8U6_9CAUD|nr:membrane protein [Streptomyces phage Hiyaa]AZS06737.1 membrane protein [Streptomyces phage Hiyaa]
MAERKQAPVSDPVEPRTRRGRRKLDDVAAEAARTAARTTGKATAAKTAARTKTALLTEQEKQAQVIARQKERKAKERKERNARRWADFKVKAASFGRTAMIVGPITAPMSIAWTGQIGFAQGILKWPFAGGVMYAAAYELSIIFCAWMYHEARKDGDSGTYYRALTWMFAVANGVQQWWHWADDWKATPRSVTYSVMTAVGILIWEAYAKLIHRRKLRADGRISNPRPRINLVRWLRYPRISFTAWSGSIRHSFDDFNDMWIWAEVEREGKQTRRNKVKELRAEVKDLKAQLADLTDPKRAKVIKAEVERVVTPDPAPVAPDPKPIDPGPRPELEAPKEADPGSPEANPGDADHSFEPTDAEIQALQEMVEADQRLNRENVMAYMRDDDNRHRLGQPEGIATKRAALVAKWGRDNYSKIKAVS